MLEITSIALLRETAKKNADIRSPAAQGMPTLAPRFQKKKKVKDITQTPSENQRNTDKHRDSGKT